MPQTIQLGPVTRVEGHLDVEIAVDLVGGRRQVVDAKCSGTMFRGFENILAGRSPLDAVHLTQRVCGVCPISHGMAASLALEKAMGYAPADVRPNGRILRNLVLGANFIQSHILHFYHLAAPDYIKIEGLLDMSPLTPAPAAPDLIAGDAAARLVEHYVQALAVRRKAHQMAAILGGKLPCSPVFVPGGATKTVMAADVAAFRAVLAEIRAFIDAVYLPDVEQLAKAFPQWQAIGKGCGNLLAYGAFELDAGGTTKLFAAGRFTDGAAAPFDPAEITEDVAASWYSSGTGLHPSAGATAPDKAKAGAYSWLKAPRYQGKPHEVGPLARMFTSGVYTRGISVMDRHMARALEARKIAAAMEDWLGQLDPAQKSYRYKACPTGPRSGEGLTEAARGALGHWLATEGTDPTKVKIARYQIVTPTAWNASPADDGGRKGPLEKALEGTPVSDAAAPVEVLRVIHSFDPCLACAVHVARAR
jgi:hydrogenase large subunit